MASARPIVPYPSSARSSVRSSFLACMESGYQEADGVDGVDGVEGVEGVKGVDGVVATAD